ncbi:MAG: hypothetical protein F6K01_22710 [Okeania sp. SIO1I7]|nr:hypothetical protein [Okeania sp. SIO1I7]
MGKATGNRQQATGNRGRQKGFSFYSCPILALMLSAIAFSHQLLAALG